MKNLIVVLLLSNAAHAAEQTFGTKPSLTTATPLATVLADHKQFKDQDVLIHGTANKVCEKKGCWMSFTEGDNSIRMTFKDYAFFVPKDSTGKKITAQGRVEVKMETVAEQRHYLEDAGASKAEMAKITGAKKKFTFVASGVTIQ